MEPTLNQPKIAEDKLSILETALNLVAASVSSEIIAMPYAIYHMGIYLSLTTIVIVAFLSHISNMMYLKVKDATPLHSESVYELAYLLVGRWAVYLVCTVQYVLNYTSIVFYYSIIGDTLSQLFAHIFVDELATKSHKEVKEVIQFEPLSTQILSHRATTIAVVGLALLSIIFMKQLRELKVISYIFLAVLLLLISLFFAELFCYGGNMALSLAEVVQVKMDHRLITSFAIIVFSYNVQFMVFPAYNELKNRSNARFSQSSIVAIMISTFVYMSTGLAAILMFAPDELKPDMLDNVSTRPGTLSFYTRAVFCLLIFLDVPFLFFTTKE